MLFRPLYPALKVFDGDFVAVGRGIEFAIACVQVQAVPTRDQGVSDLQVRAEFIGRPSFAWIVASDRQPAAQSVIRTLLKALNVISLPAMKRDCDVGKLRQGRVHVDTDFRISFFGDAKGCFVAC